MKRILAFIFFLALLMTSFAFPCTIISGKTKDNVVWAGNNEDFYFDFNTYLNVLPGEGKLLGAITFTYGSPESFIQGGVNEHGLFFDFNSLPEEPLSNYKDWDNKQDFEGGEDALVVHIIRNCSTVLDVIELLKKYRIRGLLYAQMHVADRLGNLAVINARGVRLAKAKYQVSTNFNVFSDRPSSEDRTCWRYPIAERLLQENGVSLESFRDVLDATHQPRIVGTIYSNVLNLTTGDVYNYYAGDFKNVYYFNVKEMLKKGKISYLWRSLFPDAPVVRVWETYLAKGTEEAIQLFRQIQSTLSEKRRAETLRHVFSSCLLVVNKYADAKVFFKEWLKENEDQDKLTNFYNGLIHLTNGDYAKAKHDFSEQIKINETDEVAQRSSDSYVKKFSEKLRGKMPSGANTRFELKGFQEAKFVCVFGIGWLPVSNFLLKTQEGWAADFALPSGKHHYAFLVDGEMILDPANPEKEEINTEDGRFTLNIKIVE